MDKFDAPVFQVLSLSKSYKQGLKQHTAIKDISLNVQPKDVYGIIGLSGAGKSTLLRCLARLITPSSGKILFHDTDLSLLNDQELRSFHKKTGMIFQHFNLLGSRTVAGNIALPLEIAHLSEEFQEARIDELLDLVGLRHKKDHYPMQLSGGEKQRVGIARALANHPEILFCDEATSALDPKTTKEILSLLNTLNKNLSLTIILITHEMEVVKQICNKVAVIDKGTIIEEGLVTDVFSNPQHPITRQFLEKSSHEIPTEFLHRPSRNRQLLRLKFKGKVTGEPVISEIARNFEVNANILLGWIDRLQSLFLGTLVIELTGSEEGIQKAMSYLKQKSIDYEVIENGSR